MFFEAFLLGRTTNPGGRIVSVFPVNVLVPFRGTSMGSSKTSKDPSAAPQGVTPEFPVFPAEGVRRGKWQHQIHSLNGSVNTVPSQ